MHVPQRINRAALAQYGLNLRFAASVLALTSGGAAPVPAGVTLSATPLFHTHNLESSPPEITVCVARGRV